VHFRASLACAVFVVAQPDLQKARRLVIIVFVLFWRFFVDVVQLVVQVVVLLVFVIRHSSRVHLTKESGLGRIRTGDLRHVNAPLENGALAVLLYKLIAGY